MDKNPNVIFFFLISLLAYNLNYAQRGFRISSLYLLDEVVFDERPRKADIPVSTLIPTCENVGSQSMLLKKYIEEGSI